MDRKSSGFTLVELIVVSAIVGAIVAIAVPRLTGFRSMTEDRVCGANLKIVERMYSTFLLENAHEDSIFNQFFIEIFDRVCPNGGVISYEDGSVKCSLHEDGSDEDEPPKDEVPWL